MIILKVYDFDFTLKNFLLDFIYLLIEL